MHENLRTWDDVALRLSAAWHWQHIKQHAWIFLVLLDFCVMDACTTIMFMHELGVETETHDWIRTVSVWWGPLWGPIIGKGCQFMAFYVASVLAPRIATVLGLILCTSYLFGAVINALAMMKALA